MHILMAIKTRHLDYDDRLRKETRSLLALGAQVTIFVLEQSNEADYRTVYGGAAARVISLWSRARYPSQQRLWLKSLELYARLLREVWRERPQIVWVHDMTFAGVIPFLAMLRSFGIIQGVVWDQHELPPDGLLQGGWRQRLLVWLMNRPQVVLQASEDRQKLLEARLGTSLHTPLIPLENYPDQIFRQQPRRELPATIQTWLQGTPYFLAQGGAHGDRHLEELVEAILGQQEAKLIVLGGFDPARVEALRQKHGPDFDRWVRFVPYVPQLDVPIYIDAAIASVVFYAQKHLNWIYCAPNRLYQALARGVPVVVGRNPPLQRLIDTCGCGVTVDETQPESIRQGLLHLLHHRSRYQARVQNHASRFLWETQTPQFQRILQLVSSSS